MSERGVKTSESMAEHYSASRAQVLNEAFNSLVLLHGGGAVALIAFLQENWTQQPNISQVILSGIAFFVLGLAVAIPIPLLRYRHSHLWEERERYRLEGDHATAKNLDGRRKPYVRGYLGCYVASMMFFVVGAGWIVCGALRLIP